MLTVAIFAVLAAGLAAILAAVLAAVPPAYVAAIASVAAALLLLLLFRTARPSLLRQPFFSPHSHTALQGGGEMLLEMDQLRSLALVCAVSAWTMELLKQRSDVFKRIMFQVVHTIRDQCPATDATDAASPPHPNPLSHPSLRPAAHAVSGPGRH